MRKLGVKELGAQLSVIIIGGLLLVSTYSIISTYNNHITSSQNAVVEKLHSITKTASVGIDGDLHQSILRNYPLIDDIKTVEQDNLYNQLYKEMKAVQDNNNLKTDIYTLFLDSERQQFYFAISSGEKPYYRHEYKSYPKEIKENYDTGGTITPYTDDHGTWLSAFSPIKDIKGETVAIIQADIQFDSFIEEARSEMYHNIIMSVVVFLLITGFILYTVKRLSKIDSKRNQQLMEAFGELKVKNKDITDSINYAHRIQQALFPTLDEVRPHLKDSFIFYEPKDIVSGDFPWLYRCGDYIYIAAIDCTGHGVPGAMMSVIGHLLLNDILNNGDHMEPGELLNTLHKSVVDTLKQYENTKGISLSDGMDVAMCRIDLNNKEVHYAGAHRPLYHLKNNEIIKYKGSKYPIGGAQYKGLNKFENQVIKIEEGDSIYFFSDGLPDQFDGKNENKFGPKRIRDIILNSTDFNELKNTFRKSYLDWKGDTEQIDDILLIGVKF